MDLSPEEKAVGKENFHVAIGHDLTRRKFLENGIRQGIASERGLGAYYYGYEPSVSSPVPVGVIGTGDEGNVLIGACNPKFITVAAIADIRPYNIHRAFHGHYRSDGELVPSRPGLLRRYGWPSEEAARKEVKVYEGENGDYRELIDNAKEDGIEAVIIALPLHLHAKAAIAAMKAGLHVLTEKLMAHSVHECKEMARVAEQKGLYLATGHQRHYNILYDNAVELIRRGLLGDLHYIRAQWHRGNLPGRDSWKMPLPPGVKSLEEDPDADRLVRDLNNWKKRRDGAKTDSDRQMAQRMVEQIEKQIEDKIVKAGEFEYLDAEWKMADGRKYRRPALEELIRWRLWDRTGGGLMAELGSHQLDAAGIFISAMHQQKQYPLCVSAAAGRPVFPADRDVEDHVYCLFEFPAPDYSPKDDLGRRKKISVAYASINGNGFGGYGETVFGTEGTLILDRELEVMLYQTAWTSDHIKVVKDAKTGACRIEREQPKDEHDEESAAVGRMASVAAGRGYTEQLEHWAWCVRNPDPENQPRCHPKVALADAVVALTTNIVARGEHDNPKMHGRVEFQKEWFDPDRDETPEDVAPDLSRYA